MEAYENITQETYLEGNFLLPDDDNDDGDKGVNNKPPARIVGLTKNPNEPLVCFVLKILISLTNSIESVCLNHIFFTSYS